MKIIEQVSFLKHFLYIRKDVQELQFFTSLEDMKTVSCKLFLLTFLTYLTINSTNSRKLASTLKKCNIQSSNFNQCLTEAVLDAIRQLKSPIRKMGLPSLEPLVIPAMSIGPGPGITGFQQNYTDLRLSGLRQISCSKVEMNFESKEMVMNCSSPGIRADFEYCFNGTMGGFLPIYGSGPGSIYLDRVNCFHQFFFKEYEKNGRTHFMVTHSTVDINPRKIFFNFENLYDGNQNLNKNINLVINDNWEEIYADVRPSYEEAFSRVFASLFNSVLMRVPVSEIFEGWTSSF